MGTRTVAVSPAAICITDKSSVGVPKLLEDLFTLCNDRDGADIVFVAGRDETHLYAHKLLMKARCEAFYNVKRNELCKIPGTTVTPASHQGQPTSIRWPKTKPNILKEVLIYIYTGRIVLQDNNVFEALAIAHELGVDELRKNCEDHILSTLNVQNASTFLAAALELQSRSPISSPSSLDCDKPGGQSFVERCTQYIGENATEVVKSTSFLNLPKDALVHLMSSDNLAMEEEDVWRAALAWAKHQAGVTQPTAHWSEEERVRVCQHLQGIINHVRILLIDSQVFAEEVEPTGAVPMEISLERYRFAALPTKYSGSDDRRVQPRTYMKLFNGTKLLTGERTQYQRLLNNWHGSPKATWRLLYRASTHGFSADAFHNHCDGHSPTFVIAMGTNGNICGGYADAPWGKSNNSRGRYVPSEKAFLFTLVNNSDQPPTKYELTKKMFAFVHHPDFGPVFGAGADLSISSNCHQSMDSYSNMPHSYDGDGASSSLLMGDYNFTIVDYEVFTLSSANIRQNN